jgi:hypothetical protein
MLTKRVAEVDAELDVEPAFLRVVTRWPHLRRRSLLPEMQRWTRTPGKLPSGFTMTTRGS